MSYSALSIPSHALLSFDSTNANILLDQSIKKYSQKDFAGAIADLNQAVKISPRYARAYNVRGKIKTDQGNHSGSIIDYDIAIKLDPKYAKTYDGRGVAKAR